MNNPKFRAWVNNRMMDVMIMEGKPYIYWIGDGDCELTYREIDCEPMQYTGLKDKHGKVICEGDIVKFYHASAGKHTVGEIVYHKASFVAKFNYMKPEVICALEVLRDCEVIGNIYKNRELLEVQHA